ncbi:V-type ATPase 116kDa subunit family protein [uncultured archaeon]|nr:V-type ATPase 116kDa subunit family protein [uncultured archaeon]
MLGTEEMQKVRIIALRSNRYDIIRELHKKGVIDIRKSSIAAAEDAAVEIPELNALLVRFRSADSTLKKYLDKKAQTRIVKHLDDAHTKAYASSHKQLEGAKLFEAAGAVKAIDEIFSLEARKTAIDSELGELAETKALASHFVGTGIDFLDLRSEFLTFRAFSVAKNAHAKVDAEMAKLKGDYEVIDRKAKDARMVFIACRKGKEATLDRLTAISGVYEIDIDNSRLDAKAEDVLAKLGKRESALAQEKASANARLSALAKKEYLTVASITEMLSVEADRAGVSENFKKTDYTLIVEGWVLKRKLDELRADVLKATKGRFTFETLATDELAPTLVKRPGFLRPFDFLVSFVNLPRSDEIDPTWIFILTFPIFYGLMIADVGYGVMSLLLASAVIRITNPDDLVCNTAKIWRMCSLSIIVFGVLSNQYFGIPLNQYFMPSLTLFDWVKDITTILAVSILMGITQITLGLAFSFINHYKRGHVVLAISKLTSIVFLIGGTIALAGALFGMFSYDVSLYCGIASIIAVLATAAMSGIEATEITSLLSHPLSYARLMGFGLSSVMTALLIDMAFTPSLDSGILVFSVTLIVFILLHFMNMILGIFEGSVQAVRLNFVEFFSKFYEGGGVKFSPFAYKRRYTKED